MKGDLAPITAPPPATPPPPAAPGPCDRRTELMRSWRTDAQQRNPLPPPGGGDGH